MTDDTRKSADSIDPAKRDTLDRMIKGAAFVVPVVASFAMDGLKMARAQSVVANGSGVVGN
jgi:hypothetical protein